jgi:hypothetical protein
VEALVERGSADDLAEAQAAIDWRADLPREDGSAVPDITLLHAQALVARARSDDDAFRDVAARYLAMAESLGFEGHIAWALAMADGMS